MKDNTSTYDFGILDSLTEGAGELFDAIIAKTSADIIGDDGGAEKTPDQIPAGKDSTLSGTASTFYLRNKTAIIGVGAVIGALALVYVLKD